MNYIYILRCGDGSLYTGWTNHLEKRIAAHSEGRGAKYTKSRLPVCLVHSEAFETRGEAMRREYAIKQLSREEKLKLVSHPYSYESQNVPAQIEPDGNFSSTDGDESLG
jgi:putative endonuclease